MKIRSSAMFASLPALLVLVAAPVPTHGWMNPLTSTTNSNHHKKAVVPTRPPVASSSSPTSNDEWHKTAVAVAAVSAVLLTASPMTVNAASNVDFTGSYSDPFHPNCQRVITSTTSTSSAPTTSAVTIRGTDGNPGCPTDGSGTPWSLTGTVNLKDQSILVDFTPKGGPPNLKGVWDVDSTSPGIKWPDGNKWTKIG